METELPPPFEINAAAGTVKIKIHGGIFFRFAPCSLYKLLGFCNSIWKICNAGLTSSSEVWGLGKGEEFILEFRFLMTSTNDKGNIEKQRRGPGKGEILYNESPQPLITDSGCRSGTPGPLKLCLKTLRSF